jgi:hypothetical protein
MWRKLLPPPVYRASIGEADLSLTVSLLDSH